MNELIKLFLPPIFYKLHLIPLFLKSKMYKNIVLKDELKKQISEIPEINKLFPENKIKYHYITGAIRDTNENPDLYITQLRFYWCYKYFKKNYPDIFKENTTVLDIGGTSGIFLESINKNGTIVNIDKKCINFLNKKNIKTIQSNAENIKLVDDKSFDYAISFQCLEHLLNPIRLLNEMGRIAKKKVFISIPYTKNTKIYDMDYGVKLKKESWKLEGNVKIGEMHVFEFSTEDFKKILSYTNLIYENNFPILYFDNNTSFRRFYNKFYKSYFNFFILNPGKIK